jgi:hypothetical protein
MAGSSTHGQVSSSTKRVLSSTSKKVNMTVLTENGMKTHTSNLNQIRRDRIQMQLEQKRRVHGTFCSLLY